MLGMRTMLVAVVCATTAAAQTIDKKGLTLAGAEAVIAAARADAMVKGAPGGVIAVADEGGHLVALTRLDGTFPAGSLVSAGKAKTAALFKKPTGAFEELINKGRTAMAALPPFSDFTPLQGGVPLLVDGQVVGAVGVSGAASAAQDEEIAKAGAAGLAAAARPVAGAVTYIPRPDVEAAFAKGAVLLDGTGRNYMVHASRRDKAGLVEVHAKDTDIVHVLSGEATLVTGGAVVEPKTVEPDEIRGTDVQGGVERVLRAGDVIVIPAGTPHWFKRVPAVLTYYVVKVR